MGGIVFLIMLWSAGQGFCAKEETAHMAFKTTALSKDKTYAYTVKKGEWLMDILRKKLPNIEHRYTILRQLNPHLKNFDVIVPGQKLILPAIEGIDMPQARDKADREPFLYTVQPGDSLTRILLYEMNIAQEEALKTLRIIKTINPEVTDFNRLPAGGILKLPRGLMPLAARSGVPAVAPEGKSEAVLKPLALSREQRADILSQIISRMNGSVQSSGKHFIPLPQAGQLTVECRQLPVIEFDDGTVVIVDFEGRLPAGVKRLIEDSWKNYRLIEPVKTDDPFSLLRQIIQSSRSYGFEKGDKPQRTDGAIRLDIAADWIIRKKTAAGEKPYLQAISTLRSDDAKPLSADLLSFLKKQGVVWTEILDGRVLPHGKDGEPETIPVSSIFADSTKEFLSILLTNLGYPVIRETDIKIFDIAQDGFNLSVRGDLVVKAGETSVLVHHRRIPEQFAGILRERGYKIAVIEPGESKRAALERTFRAMDVPASFNRITFLLDQAGRISTSFPAFEISRSGGPLYLIDFDLDPGLHGILRRLKEVAIIRY